MTHDELIARVGRWLRNSKKHVVVLSEIGSDRRECPDVLAWKHGGLCTLVECKTSRADFVRDAKKRFRADGLGMGQQRWYATPPGLIVLTELPMHWGLIEVGPTLVRTVKHPGHFRSLSRNVRGETDCLISAIQRATDGWGRKVFGEISPVHGLPDPHPSVGAMLKALRLDNRALRTENRKLNAKLARRETKRGDDEGFGSHDTV